MSPRKYEFATEQVEEWVRKRRRKASFSQLGKEYGVDRRVIARAVRKVEASGEDQGAPARLQLTTEFLREHVEEIQTAAAYLLEVMAADALGARFPVGDESVEPSRSAKSASS